MISSNRLGLHLTSNGVSGHALAAVMRRVFDPALAARSWEQVRMQGNEGSSEMVSLTKGETVDPGNYQINGGCFSWASLLQGAQEYGDRPLYEYARQKYEAMGVSKAGGSLRWAGSTYANLLGCSGRLGAEGTWYRLGHQEYPRAWLKGPCLDRVKWPDVIVALAVSDGTDLRIVIEPGHGGGEVSLGFARLQPGRRYRLRGAVDVALEADQRGNADVKVDLFQRIELQLVPDE